MIKNNTTLVLAGFLLVFLMTSAAAASGQQATGSIVSIDDESIVIEVNDGEEMTFQITENTEKPGDLEKGDRVTVSYHASDDGKLVADQVTSMATQTSPSEEILRRN